MRPEEWTKQWQEYFDELDKCMNTIEKASNDLSMLSIKLGKWLDADRYRMISELYAQNPLLAALMKGVTDDPFTREPGNGVTSPFTQPVETPDERMAFSIWDVEWYGGPISATHVTRFLNELNRQGIKTIGDLMGYTQRELLHMPWMGKKTLAHIVETLGAMKLELKER